LQAKEIEENREHPQIDNGSLQADCSYQPSFDKSHEGRCFAFQDQENQAL